MLMAEDLLLLLTDDATGKLSVSASQIDIALGGANMVELTLMHKVDITREADGGKAGRIVVRDVGPVGEPVLDKALEILVARQGKKPAAVLSALSKNLRHGLYDRLVETGILRAERGKVLGIFPTHRWPAQDADHEVEVRRLVTQTLVHGTTSDERIAALVSLLHALRAESRVVDPKQHGVTKKHLRARAGQLAEGCWGSVAVRKAIDGAAASAGFVGGG